MAGIGRGVSVRVAASTSYTRMRSPLYATTTYRPEGDTDTQSMAHPDVTDCGLTSGCAIDWVSVSPSGRYVVVAYSGDRIRVYDVDAATLTLTPRPMPAIYPNCGGTAAQGFIYDLGHADMTLNPFDNQEDVLVGQEHCQNAGKAVAGVLIGGVAMARRRDARITSLTEPPNEAYPSHISTRNFDRPGWAYVTYS